MSWLQWLSMISQLKRYIKQVKIDILTMLADFNSAILSCASY